MRNIKNVDDAKNINGWGSKFGTIKFRMTIFWNPKIANSDIMKHELFDIFFFEFVLSFFSKLFEHPNI